MHSAGARALRGDDNEMSREAVLLQWERKIEAAERRTITITGQPTPAAARRRRPVVDAQLAQPDRIALWAFLLGLFLVAVAAGTAHA